MAKTSNISIAKLRTFLKKRGCKHIRTNGGHEVWQCNDLLRPIIFQTHINPVPEFVILQIIRVLGISKIDFLNEI